MDKMLITGADGFLGARAAAYWRAAGWCVTACGHGSLDIADPAAVHARILAEAPDLVLHCAAISDTGRAEREPALSRRVNIEGTANVAAACAAAHIKLVYMSSDQVYTGCADSAPLTEDMPLAPVNVYGRHKYEAEQRAAALCPQAVGLRLAWMYDLAPCGAWPAGSGWPARLLAAAESGVPAAASAREHRGIACVWEIIARLTCAGSLPGGVYNFGSENAADSLKTWRAAARLLGLPESCVCENSSLPPRNLSMNLARLRANGLDLPDTLTGLQRALAAQRAAPGDAMARMKEYL